MTTPHVLNQSRTFRTSGQQDNEHHHYGFTREDVSSRKSASKTPLTWNSLSNISVTRKIKTKNKKSYQETGDGDAITGMLLGHKRKREVGAWILTCDKMMK